MSWAKLTLMSISMLIATDAMAAHGSGKIGRFVSNDPWKEERCDNAAGVASSGTMATHCARFIAPKGLVARGKHKGEPWYRVFPRAAYDHSKDWKLELDQKGKYDVAKMKWVSKDGKVSLMTKTHKANIKAYK